MLTNYSPRGYPADAIAYLKAMPADADPPLTSVIADAIGCPPDAFSACMTKALNAGFLKRRRDHLDARRVRWSLGDCGAVPSEEHDDDPFVQIHGGSSMRTAMWSDGSLVIERGGRMIKFSVDETLQIMKYLGMLGQGA